MLYNKEILILEEVTSTLLSNEIRKISNQVELEGSGLVVMEGKEEMERKVQVRLTFVTGKVIGKGLQASTRVVEEKRANCEGKHSRGCIGRLCVNNFYR